MFRSTRKLDRNRLPRFNMPLELGLFLGAKWFGAKEQKKKICLILDEERYRFQKFCSDIAGQDIRSHSSDPVELIIRVRDWLSIAPGRQRVLMPGGEAIAARFASFLRELPSICRDQQLNHTRLAYSDYLFIISRWQENNPLMPVSDRRRLRSPRSRRRRVARRRPRPRY